MGHRLLDGLRCWGLWVDNSSTKRLGLSQVDGRLYPGDVLRGSQATVSFGEPPPNNSNVGGSLEFALQPGESGTQEEFSSRCRELPLSLLCFDILDLFSLTLLGSTKLKQLQLLDDITCKMWATSPFSYLGVSQI